MAKKVKEEKQITVEKINSITVNMIDRHIRNFLITTKNQEEKVDNILKAITNFNQSLQDDIVKMLESHGIKYGDQVPEEKIEVINTEYKRLISEMREVEKSEFSQYTEEEFAKSTEGFVLPYQDLKVLKYWLIK